MQPFLRHEGIAAVLPDANINTDTIIRIERLMLVPRAELGAWAFEMLRFDAAGRERADFVLNREPFRDASILVCGKNFGCGSSRETAVWALVGRGIRCVIAPSFGDIFRENCIKNGLLPIALEAADCAPIERALAEANDAEARLAVDLDACEIVSPEGRVTRFEIPPFDREQLLSGEDEIATTLKNISSFQAQSAAWEHAHPWSALRLHGEALSATSPATSPTKATP